MANTLYEYYTGIGQRLPSVQERAKIFEQYGLGSAGSYYGTSSQNTSLLQRLKSGQPNQNQQTSSVAPTVQRTQQDFSDIYRSLEGVLNQGNARTERELAEAKSGIFSAAQAKSNAILGLAPTIRDIYSNLADQLEMQSDREFKAQERTNTRQSAEQTQQAAISGFETGSGYEAAIMRGIEREQGEILGAITEKWGLKQEQLASEQLKDLKTLEVEAADALLQGRRDVAAIIGQIATIRQQGAQLLTQASTAILNATDQRQAQAYQQYYNNQILQLQERELDLTAAKMKLDQQRASSSDDLSGLMEMLLGSGGAGANSAADLKKFTNILDKYLPKEKKQSAREPNMSTNNGPVYASNTPRINTSLQSPNYSPVSGASAALRR